MNYILSENNHITLREFKNITYKSNLLFSNFHLTKRQIVKAHHTDLRLKTIKCNTKSRHKAVHKEHASELCWYKIVSCKCH